MPPRTDRLLILGLVLLSAAGGYWTWQTHLVTESTGWGPAQTGTIVSEGPYHNGQLLAVQQPSGAVILLLVRGCNYPVGSTVQYQASSGVDGATGTQDLRLVGAPAGCSEINLV